MAPACSLCFCVNASKLPTAFACLVKAATSSFVSKAQLYQFHLIHVQFEGVNLTLTMLKISHLEQVNSKIFSLLSTRFSCFKIDHLIKQVGIGWSSRYVINKFNFSNKTVFYFYKLLWFPFCGDSGVKKGIWR